MERQAYRRCFGTEGVRWRGALVSTGSRAGAPIRASRKSTRPTRNTGWALARQLLRNESAPGRAHRGHVAEIDFHFFARRDQNAFVLPNGFALAHHLGREDVVV